MRTARAKVVKGRIVTRAKFSDGTKLVLVVDESQPGIELVADDEQAFDEAMLAVRRGEAIPRTAYRAGFQSWLRLVLDGVRRQPPAGDVERDGLERLDPRLGLVTVVAERDPATRLEPMHDHRACLEIDEPA